MFCLWLKKTLTVSRFLLIVLITVTAGCDKPVGVDSIKQQGELVVITRNAPTVYFIDKDGNESGMDHDLITAFAEAHKLKIKFIPQDTIDDVLNALQAGQGHIAAAGLTLTEHRSQKLLASGPYQTVSQQVVCRRNGNTAKSIETLQEVRLSVIGNSSYVNQLNGLKSEYPELTWTTNNEEDTEQLLKKVWDKEIDCTIADSNIVAINRRYHPELITPFSLTEEQPLVFYMRPEATKLQQELNNWIEQYRASGGLDELIEKHYGFIEIFDYVDTRKYVNRIQKRLPKYIDDFKTVAEKHNLPWTLVAAQAYQESHWNPKAKSPTGVRGIMMLTQATARELGVKNRLNAAQSIRGGAKYLDRLRERLPEEIEEPDRTWFALAAYNIGIGHLKDARGLAAELNKDANRWADLKEVLPLLANKQYYKKLTYGYARGSEPVQYVTRVRDFEDILIQHITQNRGGSE